MLELSKIDIDKCRDNLILKRRTFKVLRKRGQSTIFVAGKQFAKIKSNSELLNSDALKLFSDVKKNVNYFIKKKLFEENQEIEIVPNIYGSKFSNKLLFNELEIGDEFIHVDVKHCYWRIAMLKGYIKKSLYDSVVKNKDPQFKLWRNMSLSCIVAPKKAEYFINGKSVLVVQEDFMPYDTVYRNIRYTAWNLFGKICDRIGRENVIGYNTDGIMVFKEDLAKVTSSLASNKLKYTILTCHKSGFNEYTTSAGKIQKL